MPGRLEYQKLPGRYHRRLNTRYNKRGGDTIPRYVWGDTSKGAAVPGGAFPTEPTVTASDSTNAARLAGLGYVASPTSAWTTGQAIYVGGFAFNWTSAAWAAGAHA